MSSGQAVFYRRPELRWALVAAVMLAAGALGAEGYVRSAARLYEALASLAARGHPWTVTSIDVAADGDHPGLFLRLHGDVRVDSSAIAPAARVIGRVQVGGVIEGPLVFWTLLLAWPFTARRTRLTMLAYGLPMFVILETGTTVSQLLAGFAQASAMIAGDHDPLTSWERWSRFVESGGRDMLAMLAALLTVMLARAAPIVAWRRGPSAAPGDRRPKVVEVRR
jgi:hypothetical protein